MKHQSPTFSPFVANLTEIPTKELNETKGDEEGRMSILNSIPIWLTCALLAATATALWAHRLRMAFVLGLLPALAVFTGTATGRVWLETLPVWVKVFLFLGIFFVLVRGLLTTTLGYEGAGHVLGAVVTYFLGAVCRFVPRVLRTTFFLIWRLAGNFSLLGRK